MPLWWQGNQEQIAYGANYRTVPIIERYQLSNDCTPEKLLPNYIACTEEHGGMRFLPRGVRAVPSHRVSRKGKPKELEKQVLLRGWRLLSSVFLHLLS